MKSTKLNEAPLKDVSFETNILGIEGKTIYKYRNMVPVYRVVNPIAVKTGKKETIRGGEQLFRITVYNHVGAPNLILISIWTYNNGSGIANKNIFQLNPTSGNIVTIFVDENKEICFDITSEPYSLCVIEDLSGIKYKLSAL